MTTAAIIAQLQQLAVDRRDESLRKTTQLMSVLNDRVVSQVNASSGAETFNASYYPRFKIQLDGMIKEFAEDYGVVLSQGQKHMYDVGIRFADDPLTEAGVFTSLPAIGEQILSVAAQFNADHIAKITSDAKRLITTEIQLAVTGTKTPQEVISAIGRNLEDQSKFASINARARTITVTEIKKVQNLATKQRIDQWGEIIPTLQKTWMHSGKTEYRPGHLFLDGVTIGFNELFNVNGHHVHAPHDPALPVGEVVNCGCGMAASVPN